MWRVYLVLSLQVLMIESLPMHLPGILPQPPLPLLQEELLRLQAMQFQRVSDMHQLQAVPAMQLQDIPATPMNQIQPIIVLLPGLRSAFSDNNGQLAATKRTKDKKEHKETVDEDLESVMIEAEEPIPTIDDQKAVLLMPNPRFTINSIISAIPFLPFEINVPDIIAWMYKGIVSIIGQIQNAQGNRIKFKNVGNFGNLPGQQLRPIIVIPM